MSDMIDILAATAGRTFSGGESGAWARIVAAGLHRVLLPEDQGGAGDAFEEAAAVATQIGAKALAAPLDETIVANWCLAKAGLPIDDRPCAVISAALVDARLTEAGTVMWSKPFFLRDDVSRAVVALASPRGPVLGVLDGLPAGEQSVSMAGDRGRMVPASTQGFRLTTVAPFPEAAPDPLVLLALLKASAIAGALDAVLGLSIEYANTRKQFGRTIGQFQAVQHMTAKISGEVVAAAACVQHAARALAGPHGAWSVAVAKGFTSEAAGTVAALAHQIHGAIGFTEDFVLQRYTKRLWTWREDAGSEIYWFERLGGAALGAGESGLWPAIVEGLPLTE